MTERGGYKTYYAKVRIHIYAHLWAQRVNHLKAICNEKHSSANPRHNLTEMLHVLSEQTGMKLSCIKPTSKVRGLSIEPCSSTVCID